MPAPTDRTSANASHTVGKQAAAGAAGQSLPALPVLLKAEGESSAPALFAPGGNREHLQPFQLKELMPARPNATGMPDQLKSGIESLSGIDLSDVKVHYNSAEPAQLQAPGHRYTPGCRAGKAPAARSVARSAAKTGAGTAQHPNERLCHKRRCGAGKRIGRNGG